MHESQSVDSIAAAQEASGPGETAVAAHPLPSGKRRAPSGGLDWRVIAVVAVVGLLLAGGARQSAQPPTSLVPVAVLSAAGCGLLITALRKRRTLRGPGLLEAAIAGAVLALCHLLVAISYPTVLPTLLTQPELRLAFLSTWALITLFAIVLSMAGAALGHLAFAPLRPRPSSPTEKAKSPAGEVLASTVDRSEDDENGEESEEGDGEEADEVGEDAREEREDGRAESEQDRSRVEPTLTPAAENEEESGEELEAAREDEPGDEAPETEAEQVPEAAPVAAGGRRSLFSDLIAVVMLALLPTMAGYLFAAAYDAMLMVYQFPPGPFPTLRLLSALLPWQVPLPIHLNSADASLIIFSLLWRIPLFLGNGGMFDVLALEPFVLNGLALALLLLFSGTGLAMPAATGALKQERALPRWPRYLLLTALGGLVMVLAPDLWIFQGLAGLLEIPHAGIALPLRTLHVLDTQTFALNLISAPLVCLLLAWVVRWLYGRASRSSPLHSLDERADE
jgi:hypothetical protein